MADLLLFARAREVAGVRRTPAVGTTVGEVLANAVESFGPEFERLLVHCRVWRNGDPAESSDPVDAGDEIAVLPPVSGG